jgi:hypothetical protein
VERLRKVEDRMINHLNKLHAQTVTLYAKKEVYDKKIIPKLKENYLSEPVTDESSVCHVLKYGPVLTESSRKTSNISVTLNSFNPIFGKLEKFLTKEDIE